jgi:hypothetical protein
LLPHSNSNRLETEAMQEVLVSMLVRSAEEGNQEKAQFYLRSAEQAGMDPEQALQEAQQQLPDNALLASLISARPAPTDDPSPASPTSDLRLPQDLRPLGPLPPE